MKLRVLYSVIIISILLFSCSKDEDDLKPTIVVHSPTELQQVNGIDTLQVMASISDDENIERVNVSLLDGNGIPVLSTTTKTPNSADYELNTFYFFDDIHILSGEYDLSISASDGENITTNYVTIYVNETPKTREGSFVMSNSGSMSDIYYLDNTFNGTFYQSINGDYMGSAINSFDQQLIHASSGTAANASVNGVELNSGLVTWNVPIINSPPTPFYTGFLYDNQTTYLGKRNGGVQGYNSFGIPNFNSEIISNFYVESFLIHDNLMITEQKAIFGNTINLIPYWMASGVQVGINAALLAGEDVVGMYTKSANEAIVITNDVSLNGNLIYYNPNTGSITSFSIGLGMIDDCVEIGVGVYLVAHGGNISTINTNNNFPFATPTVLIAGAGANNLWYDDLSDELFVANGNLLTVYSIAGTQIGSYTHINPIKEVIFWYNK